MHFEKIIGDQVHCTIPEDPFEFDDDALGLDASASVMNLKSIFSKCSIGSQSSDQISFKSAPELVKQFSGSDVLQQFLKKKIDEDRNELPSTSSFDPRALYSGRPELVPNNSEDDTESL